VNPGTATQIAAQLNPEAPPVIEDIPLRRRVRPQAGAQDWRRLGVSRRFFIVRCI